MHGRDLESRPQIGDLRTASTLGRGGATGKPSFRKRPILDLRLLGSSPVDVRDRRIRHELLGFEPLAKHPNCSLLQRRPPSGRWKWRLSPSHRKSVSRNQEAGVWGWTGRVPVKVYLGWQSSSGQRE